MDTYTIDVELEHYYGDRMATSSREACRRFYLRAVSRCNAAELERYLRVVKAHASVYSSVHHMFRSPFKHVELPLFLTSLVLFISSLVMVCTGATSVLIAGGTSAGFLGMVQCARQLIRNWQQHSVREAVFSEFAEFLQQETTR
ncbi:MAG: hypothetical protein FPO08_07900 [Geobacter sp.]|jgi:hypothetical protein|uniref:GSU0071 family protein n=1 Tax=Geomonas ferrireducens TaxID=2570227 RepID=UPI0010A84622|nr:hypothetical protein [Geomonas ferrireducens]TSK06576.1 MAG: hypothetical protein FPO08_07900 [Geobacter sp.]